MKRFIIFLSILYGIIMSAQSHPDFRLYDLREASVDSVLLSSFDTTCTFRVHTRGITDQRESGLCWYFSTMNILRAEAISKYGFGEFYFSQTYGQYWDLYEKAKSWLEYVCKYRGEEWDTRIIEFLFKKPISDGGHFMNAAHLIDKYGAVPDYAMPERYSSSHNSRLMRSILTVLRHTGVQLRKCRDIEIEDLKAIGLDKVRRLLDATIGVPPDEFEFCGEIYTPKSFADKYIAHNMESDYAIIMNDPTRPYYRIYEVDMRRNCFESHNWTFLNLPMSDINVIGTSSLASGRAFYASVDTNAEGVHKAGVYACGIFRFFDQLDIDVNMTKEEMIRGIETTSLHALAIEGVELDRSGKPVKWLCENSFGISRGWAGFIVLSSEWYDKYLFRVAVEKRFLSSNLINMLSQKPEKIPAWNPIY